MQYQDVSFPEGEELVALNISAAPEVGTWWLNKRSSTKSQVVKVDLITQTVTLKNTRNQTRQKWLPYFENDYTTTEAP